MVRKILLSVSMALSASHSVSAACMDDLEMHGNPITGLSSPAPETRPGVAANRSYVDRYVAKLDRDRYNATLLNEETNSSSSEEQSWFDAQVYCNELTASAVLSDGTVSAEKYDDWYLPARVEWISVCLNQGSTLNYAEQTWTAGGACAASDVMYWTSTLHSAPVTFQGEGTWDVMKFDLNRYEFYVTGTAEIFNPATGETMRINPDLKKQTRCIR